MRDMRRRPLPTRTARPPLVLSRDRTAVLVALLGPFAVSALLVPFRDTFANTNAALILVLVIVAVAATGNRVAGVLAAMSAAVSFDLFLTRPYEQHTITDRADLETTALLLAVGVGTTALAAWGHRQHALANRDAGYLAGIQAAAEAVATGRSSGDLIDEVSSQLIRVLGLRACRFQYGVAGLGQPAAARRRPSGVAKCGVGCRTEGPAGARRHRAARGERRTSARPVSQRSTGHAPPRPRSCSWP